MAKVETPIIDVNDVCRITSNTIIKGEFSSHSDIRVDGAVDGTIYSDSRIVVGEKAALSGNVICNNLDFWGKIVGDVYVKDELSLKSTACIEGNLYVCKLNVELGAKLLGSCQMISETQFEEYKKKIVTNPLPSPKAAETPAAAPVKK